MRLPLRALGTLASHAHVILLLLQQVVLKMDLEIILQGRIQRAILLNHLHTVDAKIIQTPRVFPCKYAIQN